MKTIVNETNVWRPAFKTPFSSSQAFSNQSLHYYEQRMAPGEYADDILGPGFTYTMQPLQRAYTDTTQVFKKEIIYNYRGRIPYSQPVVSIVKYQPEKDPGCIPLTPRKPRFIAIYVHGWNDYFFQRELARHYALAGGAFYGIDLHNYGRSLNRSTEPGWVTDLREYGSDFSAVLRHVRREHPDLPIILQGHSTGGLICSLWAHAHPGRIAGLVLNSPWLEMQTGILSRHVLKFALSFARPFPKAPVTGEDPTSLYGQSFNGWDYQRDGKLPTYLEPWKDDPSITGWPLVQSWKRPEGRVTRAAWLEAIIDGQARVAEGLDIKAPIFVQRSSAHIFDKKQRTLALSADTVLNTDLIDLRARALGADTTIMSVNGRHDIMLSFPPARQKFLGRLHGWLWDKFPQLRPELVDGRPVWDESTVYSVDLVPKDVLATPAHELIGGLPVFSAGAICP